MPYVPGFNNDIFISFSHADDSRGWVKEFQDRLNDRLIQLGADVTIWRDSKLRGTDVFSDEIFTQLQQSALLISIVSPSGIKSHWCEDERHAFERFAALNGGLRLGNSLRAIKVVKTPLTADAHRDLFGVLGFEFYERDAQSDRFREFHHSGDEFHEILDQLAQDIKSLLDTFRQYQVAVETAEKKMMIYVATTTPDLKLSRDAIVQQLEVWGHAVIPQDSEPPRRFASFQAVAKAELAASSFSVHLVGNQEQPIPDGGQDSIAGQYELAQQLLKDRIVWVDPVRQLYSKFDEALKNGLQNGVEILRTSDMENLKDVIGDKLKQRQRQPDPPPKNQVRVELYLICDRPDYPSPDSQAGQQALQVKDYLDENGLLVTPPPYAEMDWHNLEEDHLAQLQLSDAVMVYWGTASESWFRKILRIIVKEQMNRQRTSNSEKLTGAFYFSSPPTIKSQYRKHAEFVFEQYDKFEPTALKPLLERLLPNQGTP
jgi:hypothetical protein